MEKVSLYKFTHILLLKNDSQLKQKSDKQPKKKQSPKLLKKIKIMSKKKSCLVKTKKKEKKKKRIRRRQLLGNNNNNNKWMNSHFCPLNNLIFSFSIFSPIWREKFLVSQGKKHLGPPFIFLSSHPTKYITKSFPSYFLFKIFHPPYFTSKQTYPKFEPTIEIIFLPQQ